MCQRGFVIVGSNLTWFQASRCAEERREIKYQWVNMSEDEERPDGLPSLRLKMLADVIEVY